MNHRALWGGGQTAAAGGKKIAGQEASAQARKSPRPASPERGGRDAGRLGLRFSAALGARPGLRPGRSLLRLRRLRRLRRLLSALLHVNVVWLADRADHGQRRSAQQSPRIGAPSCGRRAILSSALGASPIWFHSMSSYRPKQGLTQFMSPLRYLMRWDLWESPGADEIALHHAMLSSTILA